MIDLTLEYQAKIYLYELHNCAREHGFKQGEGWTLNQVTLAEKADLEKRYHPTVSAKVLPETLKTFFGLVSTQLNLSDDKQRTADVHFASDESLQYLIAFNTNRMRH